VFTSLTVIVTVSLALNGGWPSSVTLKVT